MRRMLHRRDRETMRPRSPSRPLHRGPQVDSESRAGVRLVELSKVTEDEIAWRKET